jgi:hypothetical protein
MAYIGFNPSQLAVAPFATKYFTGDGTTTTFTLDQSVPGANEANVEVFVENVQQNPVDAYTIGGALNNQLIFSEAPVSGAAVYVIHKGEATYNLQPSTGSVTAATLDPVLRNFTVDKFTGDGTTKTFTLTDTPYSANSILVIVDGITQTAGVNYTVSGTTLSFDVAPTAAPDNTSNITVIHMGFSSGNKAVMDASITPVKLSTGGPSWDTSGNFRVPFGGVLTAGDVSSTNGSVIIQGFYSNGGAISVFGSERSTGGPFLGYGVKPGTSQGIPVSSTAVTITRSSIVMDGNVIKFNRAGSQAVAIGSPVTMTESVRIDASGNVGIGTPSPAEILDIQGSGDLKARVYTTGTSLTTHAGVTLKTGSYEYIIQNLTSTAGSAGVFRVYDITAGTERLRIDQNGLLTLPYGQIKFPASQNASSDGNTLDDYEEGTFPISLSYSSGLSGGFTFTRNTGRYVKIGRLVHVQGWCQWTAKPSAGTTLGISLPFATEAGDDQRGGINVTYSDNNFTGLTVYSWRFRTENANTFAVANYSMSTDGNLNGTFNNGSVNSAGSFMFSGTYVTAS